MNEGLFLIQIRITTEHVGSAGTAYINTYWVHLRPRICIWNVCSIVIQCLYGEVQDCLLLYFYTLSHDHSKTYLKGTMQKFLGLLLNIKTWSYSTSQSKVSSPISGQLTGMVSYGCNCKQSLYSLNMQIERLQSHMLSHYKAWTTKGYMFQWRAQDYGYGQKIYIY